MNKPWGEKFFIEFVAKNKKIDKKKIFLKLQEFLVSKSSDFDSKEYLEEVKKFNKKCQDFDLDYYPEKSQELIKNFNPDNIYNLNLNLDLFYTLIIQKYKL